MNVKVKKKRKKKIEETYRLCIFEPVSLPEKKKINIACLLHCISCDEYSERSFNAHQEIINSEEIYVQSINIKKLWTEHLKKGA